MGNIDNSKEILVILSGIFIFSLVSFSTLFVFLFYRKKTIFLQSKFELKIKNKEVEQMNAVIQAQEAERRKIARNLHDEVGSILSMAQRNLTTIISDLPKKSPDLGDIQFIAEVLDQSISKLRTISQEIMPHFLVKFGLLKTLKRLVEQTEKNLKGPCHFTTNLTQDIKMDEHKEIQFYTIILELLTNIVKHSHPENIDLNLQFKEPNLQARITHNGVGINQQDFEYLQSHGEGMGLQSISQRLQIISGEVLYQKQKKGGSIEISIPIL